MLGFFVFYVLYCSISPVGQQRPGALNGFVLIYNKYMLLFPQNIESRLKVDLPEDLGTSLMDGVVLCHLANHIRPRSVGSIHVPSPAVVRNPVQFLLSALLSDFTHSPPASSLCSPSSAWPSVGGMWRTSWTPAGRLE